MQRSVETRPLLCLTSRKRRVHKLKTDFGSTLESCTRGTLGKTYWPWAGHRVIQLTEKSLATGIRSSLGRRLRSLKN